MTTKTIPAKITSDDLYAKAGANRLPERVVFKGAVYDGTLANANTPMEAVSGMRDAVYSTFEEVQRTEEYVGYTDSEIRVAMQAVVNMLDSGVSQVVRTSPFDKPTMMRISVGFNMATGEEMHKVVPQGATSLPFRGDNCWIRVDVDSRGTPSITANVIRGDQTHLEGLFAYIRDYADQNSIYLGQAVDTNFNFIDRTKVDITRIALTEKMQLAMNIYIRGPLVYRDALKMMRQDPKTAILFQGPPGGGKTKSVELAEVTMIMAGGIVIHVDPSTGIKGLERANMMATRLMKAGHMVMISFEDMENLATQDRAKVLEILDGVDAKSAERIIIGTTNFVQRIDRAMLRHGRFDDVLYCGLPDKQAFTQVVRTSVEAQYLGDIDFDFVFPYYEGYSYATIANAISKVIRIAIDRLKGDMTGFKVNSQDLVNAAEMVRDQHNMMSEVVEVADETLDAKYRALMQELLNDAVGNITGELGGQDNTDYDYIRSQVESGTDSVIESRIDGARIEDRTIHTN